jgi:hypothetical protein
MHFSFQALACYKVAIATGTALDPSFFNGTQSGDVSGRRRSRDEDIDGFDLRPSNRFRQDTADPVVVARNVALEHRLTTEFTAKLTEFAKVGIQAPFSSRTLLNLPILGG